jgi:hypothetical protein
MGVKSNYGEEIWRRKISAGHYNDGGIAGKDGGNAFLSDTLILNPSGDNFFTSNFNFSKLTGNSVIGFC